MTLNEYQKKASETVKESIKDNLEYFVLGLCGESGEVAEKVKKGLRDGELDKKELVKEISDVLWYLSQLSECIGVSLNEVANINLDKLRSRQKRNKLSGNGDNR